jgi:hypothetical protein
LIYRASYEIGGENYFAAMMAFASRHRTCEWREKLAAAQTEISPETYLYAHAFGETGRRIFAPSPAIWPSFLACSSEGVDRRHRGR